MEGGDSEFAKFTVPTLKAFLKAHSQKVSSNKQELLKKSAEKNADTFFPILHHHSPVTWANTIVQAFVLLHNSELNFLCYVQCAATHTQISAQKWQL